MRKNLRFFAGILLMALSLSAGAQFIDSAKGYRKTIDAADANTTFVGEAPTNAKESDARWRIYRVFVSGTITRIQYMNYSVEFNQIWALRAAANYY